MWVVNLTKALFAVLLLSFSAVGQTVSMNTSLGAIVIDLDGENAPISTGNFLNYLEADVFEGGAFYRVVRAADNDNGDPKIDVVQGGIQRRGGDLPPIKLETTDVTGIKHIDGVISMARGGPNTATSAFFIVIGDQPSLDFGGQRNKDGQGFAAFGHVIKGMDIVRTIHQIRDTDDSGDAYVKGQILAKPIKIISVSVND